MLHAHLYPRLLAAAALVVVSLASPARALALELDDVAREGELRFLPTRPDPGAYWYESSVQISEDSLRTGVVQLATCHRQLDPNQKIVIAFNPDRVQTIRVVASDGVGRAQVQGHVVEMADVQRGGHICIELRSRALERLDERSWRLHAGPLMRRYLDGYLPMQARLAFHWPDGLLQLRETRPAAQPGVSVGAHDAGAQLDLVFAGRMTATVDLVRNRP